MKTLNLVLLAFGLASCGGSSGSSSQTDTPQTQPDWALTALVDSSPLRDSIAGRSPYNDCKGLPMTGTWEIINGTLAAQDILIIHDDCLFETGVCGTLGYFLSGGDSEDEGILTAQVVGHIFPKESCLAPGLQRCWYKREFMNQLNIYCDLMEPASGPYEMEDE